MLSKFTAATAALTFLVSPALAQTDRTPAPTTPTQDEGAQPTPGMDEGTSRIDAGNNARDDAGNDAKGNRERMKNVVTAQIGAAGTVGIMAPACGGTVRRTGTRWGEAA